MYGGTTSVLLAGMPLATIALHSTLPRAPHLSYALVVDTLDDSDHPSHTVWTRPQRPQRSMPDFVYGLHDFSPENDDEISFRAGDRIEVIEKDDLYGDGWWQVCALWF